MRTFPFLLFFGCAPHALEVTSVPPAGRAEAWVWVGDPDETFLLTAPGPAAAQFAALAQQTGHHLRPATADDFRKSWPVLRARQGIGEDGAPTVEFDLSVTDHVALVNLWVELTIVRESQAASLDVAPERFLQTALYSALP